MAVLVLASVPVSSVSGMAEVDLILVLATTLALLAYACVGLIGCGSGAWRSDRG